MIVVELFLGLGAAVTMGWAAWVSKKLVEILILLKGLEVTSVAHEERLDALEELLPRHVPG